MFDGHTIVGLILSITVTVCVQLELFPDISVAVHTTDVVPTGKVPLALQVEVRLLVRYIAPTGALVFVHAEDVIPPANTPLNQLPEISYTVVPEDDSIL